MILGALWFKQEKDCDSEFFCSNSLSLHLGRIKMSRSKLKFKGRVIWTEKCGLTFHLPVIIISYTNSRPNEAVRSRCQFIKKMKRRKLTFVDKKSIKKEAEWQPLPLKKFSAKYFRENKRLFRTFTHFSVQFTHVTHSQRYLWTFLTRCRIWLQWYFPAILGLYYTS